VIAHGRLALLLAVAPLCLACVAYHEPPDLGPAERQRLADAALPRLVVGVRPPVIALPAGGWSGAGADELIEATERVRALILDLHATGLFEEVDVVGRLDREPDLTLVALEPTRSSTSLGAFAVNILFYGASAALIPLVTTKQYGARFARADAPDSALEFEWANTDVAGWLAIPLLASSSWRKRDLDSRVHTDTASRHRRFALFLLEHEEVIWGPARNR